LRFGKALTNKAKYNCQDYADALRSKYYELIKDKKIRCECGIDKSK